ncbi:hypothetical protein [Phytohabitans rumicis]|uniref:hypothetical protein n=1 Tax=Phytohabitans rumicis TaxID=1076125 RepID=UPI003530E537
MPGLGEGGRHAARRPVGTRRRADVHLGSAAAAGFDGGRAPAGMGPGDAGVSIDHTVWFHRPCRADEWLLYDCRSPWAASGRGLATGRLYAMNGDLVATVAQEGLLRWRGGA